MRVPENMMKSVARCGDWKISYSKRGEGPALLLLHGGLPGASGEESFALNVDALSRCFTVFAIDFPGWGDSSKNLVPLGQWANPIAQGGKAIAAFMDSIGLRRAHLMGQSFGGAAALQAAMDQPARIDKLVVIAPGGGIAPGRSGSSLALERLLTYYQGAGPSREKLNLLAQHLVFDKTLITHEWLERCFQRSIDPEAVANPPLRLPPDYVPSPSAALCNDPRLAEISAQVLFIWGVEDEMQPVQCLPSFHAIPRQESYLLGHCGHWPHREYPDRVNDLTRWFLARAES